MGLKIENSGLPPLKVLISKKLHLLRPAIEYVQLISKPKKVRLWEEVDALCVLVLFILVGCIFLHEKNEAIENVCLFPGV